MLTLIDAVPGTSVVVSATGSSVSGTIDCTGCDAIRVVNASTTLYVAVRVGGAAPSASLTVDPIIPPGQEIFLAANAQTVGVAAIGSGGGPTIVGFTPIRRGQAI
jgi:hypothetical protein